jgi:hypothetical protein
VKKRILFSILILSSFFGLCLWAKFIYPQLIFSHLIVDRVKALDLAKESLRQRQIDPAEFQTAIVFTFDSTTNQFLQSAIGFEGLKRFIEKHDLDMYFWLIRFFKENKKEEYRLTVSSKTGEVTSLKHVMEDSSPREPIDKLLAQQKALDFLRKKFALDESLYELTDQYTKVFDHRTEYTFAWQKKSVRIPWSDKQNSGTGKLFMSATISGPEVTHFVKNFFSVPDQFNRHIEEEENTGRILGRIIKFFYILLFVFATFYLISKHSHLATHTVKPFYFWAAGLFFVLAILSEVNDLQYTLFGYKNTSSLMLYFWEYFSERSSQIFFATIAIIIPGLAGEMLHYEVSKEQKHGSFLHSLRSTFFSRQTGWLILIGYLVFAIMLGVQSVLIKIGQDHWGVWVEHNWMAKFSTSYWPFLGALVVAYRSAFSEEILYRLFTLNWGKKIFKNVVVAVLFSSLIWGFAHSSYPVYPMWFRGVEMTIVGIFLAFVYFEFGLVTCIVGHYLFNVFWSCTDYLFGQSNSFYYYSSVFILLVPMAFSVVCFLMNRNEKERKLVWRLNKHQQHNLEILKTYLRVNQEKFQIEDKSRLRQEISSHGWDLAVVDVALEELGWVK